jgi:hypothetical protein
MAMYKKIIASYLIPFSVIFLGAITNCLAEADDNIEQAKKNIFTPIDSDSYAKAELATSKLVANFSRHLDSSGVIYWIADSRCFDSIQTFSEE